MSALKLVSKISSEPLVVALSNEKGVLRLHSAFSFKPAEQKRLLAVLKDLGAKGSADEVIKIPYSPSKLLVFTGLGKYSKNFAHETLRRAAGAAARNLSGNKSATFALAHEDATELAAIAEGAALGAYGFHEFRNASKGDHRAPLQIVNVYTQMKATVALRSLIKRAEIISEETHLVRDLVNTPPSHLTPITFSERMKKYATTLGLTVEVLNESQLKSKGYGGITAVGQGSANPPRLLRVSYTPKEATSRLAYVGKGITFDSGGLALKPAKGMEAMKSDMGGAAAVIAAVFAIAQLKLPIAVDGWAALAENMVSETATRPSDIITIYGGKTVEVINPDAEGRLVLADALVRAAEFGEQAGGLAGIVDVATLTGAQGMALGSRVSAVMTNDDSFLSTFQRSTADSGESFWPMPLPEDLRPSINSQVADLANMGADLGKMLVAGLFLREFVQGGLPWLHLDIASPAYNLDGAFGYTPVGGTGVTVRSLVRLAELVAETK
jgi:leucyl aminopeptidase